ncbi:MAG: hypothetical protein ACI303_08730, partial [Lepagella sp.]
LQLLMKLLPCLGHCFRSHIMGLYQQWAFVVEFQLSENRKFGQKPQKSVAREIFHPQWLKIKRLRRKP